MARDKSKEGAAEPVKALSGLYPARSLVDEREAHSVDFPLRRIVACRSFRLGQRDAIGRGGPACL